MAVDGAKQKMTSTLKNIRRRCACIKTARNKSGFPRKLAYLDGDPFFICLFARGRSVL